MMTVPVRFARPAEFRDHLHTVGDTRQQARREPSARKIRLPGGGYAGQPWRRRKRGLSDAKNGWASRFEGLSQSDSFLDQPPDSLPPAERLRAVLPVGTNRAS